MTPTIPSPLVPSVASDLERSIPTARIIDLYDRGFDIDVRKYFQGLKEVQIRRCPRTGYRFYYPYQLGGDGVFYEQLDRFDWYYMPWKWEHEAALTLLQEGQKVLEIGSGDNGFLEKLHRQGYEITGLELNEERVQDGKSRGLDIENQLIQDHARRHPATYDAVCAFQVLEHIDEVQSFLEAAITCLKPGGSLIVCVPNNEGFIKHNENVLNLPPHHMGLWDQHSLRNLESVFSLRTENILFQPVQKHHRRYFFTTALHRNWKIPERLAGWLSLLIPRPFARLSPPSYSGFAVLAHYKKI